MRKSALVAAIGITFVLGACKRTGDGGVEVQKPVVGTVTDTVHPPTVEVGKDTHTVVVPKVEVRKETTKVTTPTVGVKKP